MTSCSEILVLIVNDNDATLCANSDGVTRLLRKIDRVLPAVGRHPDSESACGARTFFASELMMALCRGVRERTYDGVVIFAEAPMMEELREVQTRTISQVLIAEIVGTPFEASDFPGRSTVNAQLAYRGAVH